MSNITTTDFTILSSTPESWDVQFRIDKSVMLNKESLLNHLRGIKHELAIKFDTLEARMVFDGILKREESEDHVVVAVRIKQNPVEEGDPVIRFRAGIDQNGVHYPKMRALLDLYYLDGNKQILTLDRIHHAIAEARLELKLVQQDVILSKLKEVLASTAAIKSMEISVGQFAEIGKDAEIEFLFPAKVDLDRLDEYFSSRYVSKGDVLCRITPAQWGKQRGINVVGEILEPQKGHDIQLVAENGVKLSGEDTVAVADENGIVIVKREMKEVKTACGAKTLPSIITLAVNPTLKVDGNDILDIETDKIVEIAGNLRMGSRVVSCSGIHVSGSVESGALLSGHDIVVNGRVSDSTISSDTSLIIQGITTNSDLKAKGDLVVDGEVADSKLSGNVVKAGTVSNTSIVANKKVVVDKIDGDDEQDLSKIYIGMSEFYEQRIRENEKFLQMARDKLARIEIVIGKESMDQITNANIQNRLMKLLSRNQKNHKLEMQRHVAAFRKLLESIPVLREMMEWKEAENEDMRRRLVSSKDSDANRVVIREKIGSRTIITVNGMEADVSPWDGPVEFYVDEDNYLQMEKGIAEES